MGLALSQGSLLDGAEQSLTGTSSCQTRWRTFVFMNDRSPSTPQFQGWLSKSDLAKEFPGGPVSEKTLDRWHEQRVGPPRVKCGRRVLYSMTQVEQWLSERAERPLRSGRNS
jgi:hypothetical protein